MGARIPPPHPKISTRGCISIPPFLYDSLDDNLRNETQTFKHYNVIHKAANCSRLDNPLLRAHHIPCSSSPRESRSLTERDDHRQIDFFGQRILAYGMGRR